MLYCTINKACHVVTPSCVTKRQFGEFITPYTLKILKVDTGRDLIEVIVSLDEEVYRFTEIPIGSSRFNVIAHTDESIEMLFGSVRDQVDFKIGIIQGLANHLGCKIEIQEKITKNKSLVVVVTKL